MTRICSYCDKVMGWKCEKCNTELTDLSEVFLNAWCPRCASWRKKDEGGTTHGICPECEGKVKEEGR
jgi:phage FluMu protein Com